jgi:phosphomevalonate kinase
MEDIEIFGFSGKLGSGKNYIAENLFFPKLSSQKPTLCMAIADHVKVDLCVKRNIEYNKLFFSKDAITRRLLQLEATENGRMVYGEDVWVKTLDTWIKIYASRGIKRFIVTDVRFVNEFEYIKNNSGVNILVIATDRVTNELIRETNGDILKMTEIKTHSSENGLEHMIDKFDYVIYNDINDSINKSNVIESSVDEIIKDIYG